MKAGSSGKFVIAIATVALVGAPALAHHSFAMFDNSKIVTLNGTVSAFKWTNPHIWINIVAPRPSGGGQVEWIIEGPSVNGLARIGWSRSTIRPGDRIAININPLKNGTPGGSLVSLTVNGRVMRAHNRSAGD